VISTVLPTALAISDMGQALGFYRDLLGFRVAVELPPAAERERWDAYHEKVCGIPGAQIRVVYLEAPDGATNLELIEYVRPKVPPRPRARFHEPGTAIVALGLLDSGQAVERLRAAGVDVLSDPVPYTSDDGVKTNTTYFYDPDGNALCLFELVGERR
jgi:catechol 2,3-dioxygenase-like lactoylglutathione lyase family enzyme